MVVLMACASLYAVLQLAVLGSATRSTRIGTAMLAVATGCVACGAVTIAAELIYTRLVAVLTGRALGDVVQTASYTVDPFIEEIVKILPLVLIGVLGIRRRVQWGLTDFLIIGAGVGSGFALAEALLRFSWHAAAWSSRSACRRRRSADRWNSSAVGCQRRPAVGISSAPAPPT